MIFISIYILHIWTLCAAAATAMTIYIITLNLLAYCIRNSHRNICVGVRSVKILGFGFGLGTVNQ